MSDTRRLDERQPHVDEQADLSSDDEWWDDEESQMDTASRRVSVQRVAPQQLATQNTSQSAFATRLTQWPSSKDEATKSTRSNRKSVKRYSVHRPVRHKSKGRQIKQNALAGIRVITDFSKIGTSQPQKQPRKEASSRQKQGCFVDLAALQALDGEAVRQVEAWKTNMNQKYGPGQELFQRSGTTSENSQGSGPKNSRPIPPPLRLRDDLSPSDRPIPIGISIPSASLSQHTSSPVSIRSGGLTHNTSTPQPVTEASHVSQSPRDYGPTIIITPAKEISVWSPDSEDAETPLGRARATSSIYSRATNVFATPELPSLSEIPAVPRVPSEYRRELNKQPHNDRNSVGTVFGEDEEEPSRKSRVMSSGTYFEDDESPILRRAATNVSIPEGFENRNMTLSPVSARDRSKGWWTYITTPFLTRSNTRATLSSPTQKAPALPSLSTAVAKLQGHDRENQKWEKQFSPQTPATSTTMTSTWWSPVEIPNVPQGGSRHRVQESSATIPVMLSAGGLGGATILERNNGQQQSYEEQNRPMIAPGLSRNATIRSIVTPSDREVPFLFDLDSINSSNSNNPFLRRSQQQPQGQQTTHTGSQQLIDVEPAEIASPAEHDVGTERSLSIVKEENEEQAVDKKIPEFSPPPYSPPRSPFPSNRAAIGIATQYPPSPGPFSPGLQRAMSSRGGIPMDEVPLTPAGQGLARPNAAVIAPIATSREDPMTNSIVSPRRVPNMSYGYAGRSGPTYPARPVITYSSPNDFVPPTALQRQNEKQRRKYEKEERMARKAGGLWRGRGCIPKDGCFGRGGAEGRKRRRLYFWLIAAFCSIIILVVALATTLVRKSSDDIEPSQWLNLTGFPPIYTGVSTISAPENTVTDTGCVFPATIWSCSLPKELQDEATSPDQPNFRVHIQWDNSSTANATFANVTGNSSLVTRSIAGNPVSAGYLIRSLLLKIRDIVEFIPSPSPPTYAENFFLGNTTDGIVSDEKAGEPTPFYISFLDTTTTVTVDAKVRKRETNDTSFPNVTAFIPDPDVNSDGTAAAANLLPYFTQQPIRLYDRGLPTEHYGFYNYFDRSIFLKSITAINDSTSDQGEVPDDENGGSTEAEAGFRCTWSQTRFLVQIWTRKNTTSQLLNNTSPSSLTSEASKNISFAPNDFSQPGSFPYPVTITSDRHGGDPDEKLLYCYSMNDREQITGDGTVELENRAFGGTRINPAPSVFSNDSDSSLGGFDGGTGGCKCAWQNWVALTQT